MRKRDKLLLLEYIPVLLRYTRIRMRKYYGSIIIAHSSKIISKINSSSAGVLYTLEDNQWESVFQYIVFYYIIINLSIKKIPVLHFW